MRGPPQSILRPAGSQGERGGPQGNKGRAADQAAGRACKLRARQRGHSIVEHQPSRAQTKPSSNTTEHNKQRHGTACAQHTSTDQRHHRATPVVPVPDGRCEAEAGGLPQLNVGDGWLPPPPACCCDGWLPLPHPCCCDGWLLPPHPCCCDVWLPPPKACGCEPWLASCPWLPPWEEGPPPSHHCCGDVCCCCCGEVCCCFCW